MAILSAWQRVDRVIPNQVWGDGVDGSATISEDLQLRATITGTADQKTATAGSSLFANGDLVKIIQTQGTGAGQWEYNMIASGGGSTSLVFKEALKYTYVTKAQIIKIPRYTTATVTAHSVTAWNGTTGGYEEILAKTSITTSGAINGTGKGFGGGAAATAVNIGDQGDSPTGVGVQGINYTANGAGGGAGGPQGVWTAGGGGAGHALEATGGTGPGPAGDAGVAVGTTDLTSIHLGSGGGSGGSQDGTSGAGGTGGGIINLVSRSVVLGAGINVNGNAGGSASGGTCGGGGGGAGGSVLIVCDTATLGTLNITSTAGAGGDKTGGDNGGVGGAGSVGRIAVQHRGAVTGTTTPTFTDVEDLTLIENTGMFLVFM